MRFTVNAEEVLRKAGTRILSNSIRFEEDGKTFIVRIGFIQETGDLGWELWGSNQAGEWRFLADIIED